MVLRARACLPAVGLFPPADANPAHATPLKKNKPRDKDLPLTQVPHMQPPQSPCSGMIASNHAELDIPASRPVKYKEAKLRGKTNLSR